MYFIVGLVVFALIFALILSLDLGLSIGVSFILTWLLPNISFETGVLIAAICVNFSLYFLIKIPFSGGGSKVYDLNRSYFVDEEYDEDLEEETEYQIIPTPPSPSKRRGKRKR